MPRNSFFRQLRWRISAFMAAALVTTLGTFALFYHSFLEKQVIEEASSHSALVADTIHLGLVQNMINNNREAIQSALMDIINNPGIAEVMISDPEGRIAFASRAEMVGRNLRHSSFAGLTRKKNWKVIKGSDAVSGREILRFGPIPNRKPCQRCHSVSRAVLGNIALRMSLKSGEQLLGANRYFLLGMMVLVLTVAIGVNITFFARKVNVPIGDLLRRFQEVSEGTTRHRSTLRPLPVDELGILSGRFEELVEQIKNLHTRKMEEEKQFVLQQQDRAHQGEMSEMNNLLTERSGELEHANLKIDNMARQLVGKNESLENAVKNISALNRVGVALSSELDINRLVTLLINISVKGLRSEIGYIMLIDEESGKLVMKAWTGLGENFDPSRTIKPGESVSGRVAKTGQPLLLTNVDGSGGIKKVSRYGFTRRSVISAPIKMKNKFLGVIELTNKRGAESFDEDDMGMMQSIANQAAVAIENANLYRDLQKSYFDTIRALVQAVEETDKYTRGHSERVTTFCVKIAEKMGFSETRLEIIKYGGVLHDIGKIGINVNIIQKQEGLTQEEFEIIKKHPLIGERIISPIDFLRDVLPVVSQHHERYDGKGYPVGLNGSQVVAEARVLAVADAYDAMITARPYRRPLPRSEAVAELRRCSGTQFDPLVVETFLEILEEDPEIRKLEETLSVVGA